ncbi:MAG: MFS transporter [Hyphomonadaceae bacterium]
MTEIGGTGAGNPAPRAGAWYAVFILLLLYTLSYLDRLILALLAAPISSSLHLSDTQLGLLTGSGFGIVYALCGLPIAHLIDRTHRVGIVSIGVSLWSAATIASGFATDYWQLLAARSGVAIGEAVLSPAAISIIGDMFVRERRTLPTAVYTSVGTFMTAGSFVAGGAALDLAHMLSASFQMEPWRLALVIVGLPSLILAPILFLSVREPARTKELNAQTDYASLQDAINYVRTEGALFAFVFIAMCCTGINTFAFNIWTPTLLVRAFGQTPSEAGYAFGIVGTVAGILGAILWPYLAKTLPRLGWKNAIVVLFAGGVFVKEISTIGVGLAPTETMVLIASFFLIFPGAVCAMLPPLIIQYVAPPRVRARLVAMNLLASTLVGLSIGPPLCAWIAETFYSGPHALGAAIATVTSIFGPISIIASLLACPKFAPAQAAALAREAAAPQPSPEAGSSIATPA